MVICAFGKKLYYVKILLDGILVRKIESKTEINYVKQKNLKRIHS